VIIQAYNSPSLRLALGLQGIAGGRGESRFLGDGDRGVCSFGVCLLVNGSVHCCGCVVDGPSAVAAP
jgi:hypothetical protein